MLKVLEVARCVFWDDSIYDRRKLPSESSFERCSCTLTDLATMSGKERITLMKQCGIDPDLHPLFLRSIQHLTALHGIGSIADDYVIHRRLSARLWSPFVSCEPLLGYPFVVSEAFRDRCPAASTKDETFAKTGNADNGTFSAPYIGLLNQGATCYLNSLLQALFHISAFRSIIYQIPTKEEALEKANECTPSAKSIPYALQRLFCMLQTATSAVGTTELTESFGWGAADSFIQHDVHELTCVLLDILEQKLNDAQVPNDHPRENAIHKLFTGKLESYVKVDEADYHGCSEEPFYDLQLVVKNTKNIYASLDTLFQVEVLDGKNKYCLECGGTKTYYRAEKGVRLKETPPILLLHLTRFDYDIERGETKVFTRWDYYSTLDLSAYMINAPPEQTHYTLCSVLVHAGTNTGYGHYYCFLRCHGLWYKFNDENVAQAALTEVFGDNFGGFKTNYWGSEVPHTTNAYLLVYIRTSEMDTLLKPIHPDDVPQHVTGLLTQERAEKLRIMKERAEDYLYGRVHFILPQEVIDQVAFLTSRRPLGQKFSSQRTLCVFLDADAHQEFSAFADRQMGIPVSDQMLWYSAPRPGCDRPRLHAMVKPGTLVKDIVNADTECCILVTTPASVSMAVMESDVDCEYQIFHHKLYDPVRLKVIVLGSTVMYRNPNGNTTEALNKMEELVRGMIASLPAEMCKGLEQLRTERKSTGSQMAERTRSATDLRVADGNCTSSNEYNASLRGPPRGQLSVMVESEYSTFSVCEKLSSGDILVWQEEAAPEDRDNVFYPDIQSFQHFLHHRIPVEIKLNLAHAYPTLIATELAEDMTYEQLQRFVALLIGDPTHYDHIRFTRHNPETDLPYFMKGKKRDRSTLSRLLTSASHRFTSLSRYLYFEYCKFTVTETEASHSLQFRLYDDNVKAISNHWILMPRQVAITAKELFSTCLREIQQGTGVSVPNSPTSPAHGGGASSWKVPEGVVVAGAARSSTSRESFYAVLMSTPPDDAWKILRLVDVWKGRIYNVLDKDHALVFEHDTFEESAEYRIERIPQPLPGVLLEQQLLIQAHHFSVNRQKKEVVETHSEPFSLYIGHSELPCQVFDRIAEKLDISRVAVLDWKLCLVKESRVVVVSADVPMGSQLCAFCSLECYQPNQREPAKMAFLGLEHAPTTKRATKREEKVVILN